jgi:hypothetical protein
VAHRSEPREFEQKVAKETKGESVLAAGDVVGGCHLSMSPRLMANFETGFRTTCSRIEAKQDADLFAAHRSEPRKIEQKVAKETKGESVLAAGDVALADAISQGRPRVIANFEHWNHSGKFVPNPLLPG